MSAPIKKQESRKASGGGSKPLTAPPAAKAQQAGLAARALTAGYRPAPYSPQIDTISLSLVPGELVAVIGPNGSGKSTLLRALSRTLAPTGGQVLVGEADLYADLTAQSAARAISVVPQDTDVFLDFTVRDIVAMGRAPHRAGGIRGLLAPDTALDEFSVAAALARAGIDDALAARPISQVSGGERQRALIARCLAQESPILLLDEPVSALDPNHQRRLLNWLRDLAVREGRAVLAILHDLNAAAEFAERVIVLSQGKIAADGKTEDVMTADLIQRVYGVRAWIRSNPATGRLCVLPAESIADFRQNGTPIEETPPRSSNLAQRRVHLFCGGGTGAALMFALSAAGARLSASALHEGDADLDAARSVGARHVVAPAFSRPTVESAQLAQLLADEAEAAVFTASERGEINGDTFEQASRFALSGRAMICLGEKSAQALELFAGRLEPLQVAASKSEAAAALEQAFNGVTDLVSQAQQSLPGNLQSGTNVE